MDYPCHNNKKSGGFLGNSMMTAEEFINSVRYGNIDVIEHTKKVLEEVKKINKKYNYMNIINEELALKLAKNVKKNPHGRLAGLPITVKDCICVKDVETTSGSGILKGYKPIFNATVIEKAIKEGAIIIGKTSQDEFGFGSFNLNVGLGFKVPLNPNDKTRVCGGSSGGSAGITKKIPFPHLSIAESTGGSIACPASFCGVYGFTPTYGAVSRYGLIDYGSSLDKIGTIGNSLNDCRLMMDTLYGKDKNDSTSVDSPEKKKPKKLKYAIIKETFNNEVSKDVLTKIDSLGIEYDEVSLSLNEKYSIACYYVIAMAEASTNLAKFCGMRYGMEEQLAGNYNEYFTKIRSTYLGKEAKRRIILGTFARMAGYRDAYYLKAMKVRTLLIKEYKQAFSKYDVLLSPSMPIIAPKIDEANKLTPLQNYEMDMLTVGPNLAGLPHLSMPAGEMNNMPIGLMAIADHFDDYFLLNLF